MAVNLLLHLSVAAVVVGAVVPAQQIVHLHVEAVQGPGLEFGAPAPSPNWQQWLRGAPIAFGAEAPACSVFAFYTVGAEPDADRDADYLGELQRRFADRGVRFVAVVGDPKVVLASGWAPCSVVVDAERKTTAAWCIDEGRDRNVVVLDRRGQLVFQGAAGAGLVDAVQSVVDDRVDPAKARAVAALRTDFVVGFDDVLGEPGKVQVATILAHAPRDGLAWGLAYLVAATKLADAEEARLVRRAAIVELANESRPLAVFGELALRGDPRAPGLALELAAAMQQAAAAAPRDATVQLALLRALVVAGKGREVGRQAARTQKLVHGSAVDSLTFAEILALDATPAVHRDLAEQAVRRAEALGAPARLLAATRFLVAQRCAEDAAGAKAVMDAYLEGVQARVSLNNDCWYFMTELATMGRFDRFAAALADRMLEQRDAMDYFEFDTAALAMFVAGRLQEAVELQEVAVEKGGRGNPEYAERLQRYRAAVAAAPR